ncbi:bZIP transcription factor [Aspergillus ibericus CBS 121593]|uniref:BZIP domain-containing protein n=1 Tax=Aspergillus ibericus CBS 121593 TaxID=1448316 RepID=A0A395H4I5_9EURO|nr:hypothetical protein BO80DRAFT_33020 [Aspergillus ibericus CBS 121593]RAL02359.1 hypothetical protein BO80DRAFT_33020 [Aspergillus ibericus CBS 121593]
MSSSSSSVPDTDLSDQDRRLGENTKDDYVKDNLRRLRTGKRGRPPIDPTQRGLVERRRNQVRKAQQAYRNRKEEEAARRINRIADLENRIHRMRQSFVDLISCITEPATIQSQPDLAHQLQTITRDFLSASQIEHASELLRGGHFNQNDSSNDSPSLSPGISSNIRASCAPKSPVPAVSIEDPLPTPAPALDYLSTTFEGQAPPPRNFSQRLYLNCIKRAYFLLTSPSADRAEVARVFQYSFLYSDANTMASTFDNLLRTNADYQTAYVYRLGGAGTHYKEPLIGPVLEWSTLSVADEDPWFDPRDIEGWLEENGLVIGGAQSFMYLSDLRFLPSSSVEWNIRQGVKIFHVDHFLQGWSSFIPLGLHCDCRDTECLEQSFFRGGCVWVVPRASAAGTLKRHLASQYLMNRPSFLNQGGTFKVFFER